MTQIRRQATDRILALVTGAALTSGMVLVGGGTAVGAPAAHRRGHARRAEITLTAVDPNYAYAIQVGDTITLRAVVRDPGRRAATGAVAFSSDNSYDRGCRAVRIQRSDAVCYMSFYTPGHFSVTARYRGPDRQQAVVTLRFSVVPSTSD